MAWWLSSENISLTSHPLWQHGLVVKFRKYISWRHILYDSMAWWLSSENIAYHILYAAWPGGYVSLTSHPLWQHGLVVKFRKYIADVTSFMTAWPVVTSLTSPPLWQHGLYDSMTWWLSSENISLMSHPLWQHGLVVNFRKYIAYQKIYVTSFMTAWPGG